MRLFNAEQLPTFELQPHEAGNASLFSDEALQKVTALFNMPLYSSQ